MHKPTRRALPSALAATGAATAHAIADALARRPIDITDNCLGWRFGE